MDPSLISYPVEDFTKGKRENVFRTRKGQRKRDSSQKKEG